MKGGGRREGNKIIVRTFIYRLVFCNKFFDLFASSLVRELYILKSQT